MVKLIRIFESRVARGLTWHKFGNSEIVYTELLKAAPNVAKAFRDGLKKTTDMYLEDPYAYDLDDDDIKQLSDGSLDPTSIAGAPGTFFFFVRGVWIAFTDGGIHPNDSWSIFDGHLWRSLEQDDQFPAANSKLKAQFDNIKSTLDLSSF